MLSLAARRLLAASLKSKPRRAPTALPITPLAALEPLPNFDRLSLRPMGKKSHYAVARGRAPGIYRSWDDCAAQVQGFTNNLYKGFGSELEAMQYLEKHGVDVGMTSQAVVQRYFPMAAVEDARRRQAVMTNTSSRYTNIEDSLKEEKDYEEEAERRLPSAPTTTTTKRTATTATSTTTLKTLVPPGSTARMQFDGASKRNPGPAALGAVLYDAETGFEVGTVKAYMGDCFTNNQAEYAGLIAGLQAAHDMGYDNIEVQGDSKLIVNQVLGLWRVKNEGLMPYHQLAVVMKKKFKKFRAKQVPRAENSVADALGNEAIREWNEGIGGEMWTLERANAAAAAAGVEKRENNSLSERTLKKQKLK
jgi:ribonuclease HI